MNRALVTVVALFACACIDGPPADATDAASSDTRLSDTATDDTDAEGRDAALDGGQRPDGSTDMPTETLRVVLLLTDDQVDKSEAWKSQIEEGGYDAVVVQWLDFKEFETQPGDVIVVPPDGGAPFQQLTGELAERRIPLVWMSANWAPNLGLSESDVLQRNMAVQDIVLFDHPLIDIAGIDDGSPDYEIYLSEQEVPCFTSLSAAAQPVANVADVENCESFAHVYEAGSVPAGPGTAIPARRVVLPLESSLTEWTPVASELFYASIEWAGR